MKSLLEPRRKIRPSTEAVRAEAQQPDELVLPALRVHRAPASPASSCAGRRVAQPDALCGAVRRQKRHPLFAQGPTFTWANDTGPAGGAAEVERLLPTRARSTSPAGRPAPGGRRFWVRRRRRVRGADCRRGGTLHAARQPCAGRQGPRGARSLAPPRACGRRGAGDRGAGGEASPRARGSPMWSPVGRSRSVR